jgi:hypothetical protein
MIWARLGKIPAEQDIASLLVGIVGAVGQDVILGERDPDIADGPAVVPHAGDGPCTRATSGSSPGMRRSTSCWKSITSSAVRFGSRTYVLSLTRSPS